MNLRVKQSASYTLVALAALGFAWWLFLTSADPIILAGLLIGFVGGQISAVLLFLSRLNGGQGKFYWLALFGSPVAVFLALFPISVSFAVGYVFGGIASIGFGLSLHNILTALTSTDDGAG